MTLSPPNLVLVVDDYADVRALVATILAGAGHDVVEAADGRRAVQLMHDLDPDLVMLDLSMPGMDGWETARQIREFSSVPVLFLSACVEDAVRRHSEEVGAAGFMAKPFARRELLAAVAAVCGTVVSETPVGDGRVQGARTRVA